MKCLDTNFMHISIIDSRTVLVAAMNGVEIDAEKSKYANGLIEREMPGDYGMIIDRKANYSIVPIDVYNILNSFERLKAIAIVVHGKRNFLPISMEQRLYNGQLDMFRSIRQAHEWIVEIVNK